MMDKVPNLRTWNIKTKTVQNRLLGWPVPVICFIASMAWVYSNRDSKDPYDILAPWSPSGRLRNQNPVLGSGEGLNVMNVSTQQQQLNDTDHAHEGLTRDRDGYLIRQTGIRGKSAVDQFRARTACLSGSGRWFYDPTPRKLPWLAVRNYDWVRKCDKDHMRRRGLAGRSADSVALRNGSGGTWSVREELKWVWRTSDSSCPWHPMDRDDFCRRIGSNGNVLVVGDSINHEISVALQNALLMNKSSDVTSWRNEGEELCSDVLGGVGQRIEVFFVRNDYISPVVNSVSAGRNIEDPWLPRLDSGDSGVKILLLNRGAHYQDDEKFVGGLRATFTALRDRHPELLVLYRNTPPGHVNCTDFHAPIGKPLKGSPPSFHWDDFDRQNELAREIVEEFQYIYLDVARPIGMRPEGHKHSRDCLHYCQPGPLDVAVEMIYNVLLLLT